MKDVLKGEIAVVTGGAAGIGAASARLLSARRAQMVVADIVDGTPVAESCDGEAFFHTLDVTSEPGWAAVRDATRARFGEAKILVSNAGTVIHQPLVGMDATAFRRVIDVNLVGAALGIAAFAPAMVARGRDAIVNTSSTEAFRGVNSLAAYAASKWGLRGLTKVAAMELGPHGVRVNSIHPGPTDTAMSNPDAWITKH